MTTWLRLHDGLPEHPKIVGLSHKEFRLFVESLCYSSRNLTDGFVPTSALPRLHGDTKTAEKLVAARLWTTDETRMGYTIHDYTFYQRSREQVENERRTAAERMQRVRANKQRTDTPRSPNVRLTETETEEEAETKAEHNGLTHLGSFLKEKTAYGVPNSDTNTETDSQHSEDPLEEGFPL